MKDKKVDFNKLGNEYGFSEGTITPEELKSIKLALIISALVFILIIVFII